MPLSIGITLTILSHVLSSNKSPPLSHPLRLKIALSSIHSYGLYSNMLSSVSSPPMKTHLSPHRTLILSLRSLSKGYTPPPPPEITVTKIATIHRSLILTISPPISLILLLGTLYVPLVTLCETEISVISLQTPPRTPQIISSDTRDLSSWIGASYNPLSLSPWAYILSYLTRTMTPLMYTGSVGNSPVFFCYGIHSSLLVHTSVSIPPQMLYRSTSCPIPWTLRLSTHLLSKLAWCTYNSPLPFYTLTIALRVLPNSPKILTLTIYCLLLRSPPSNNSDN